MRWILSDEIEFEMEEQREVAGWGWGGRLVIDGSSLSLSTQTRKMISMWKNGQAGFPCSPLNTGIFPLAALDYVSLCFSVLRVAQGSRRPDTTVCVSPDLLDSVRKTRCSTSPM